MVNSTPTFNSGWCIVQKVFGSILAVALVAIATPASAQFTTGFDEVAAPCLFTSTDELTSAYAASGVNFSGGSILNGCSNFTVGAAHSGGNFLALNSLFTVATQSIFFDSSWGAFSIWVGSTESAVFQFFLNGTEQFNSGALAFDPEVWAFYTYTGGWFDEVAITTGGQFLTLDDLAVRDPGEPGSTVPEPATMTLLATGMAGLAAVRRRRLTA